MKPNRVRTCLRQGASGEAPSPAGRLRRGRFRLRRNHQCTGQAQCTGPLSSQYILYWLELIGPSPINNGKHASRRRGSNTAWMDSDYNLEPWHDWSVISQRTYVRIHTSGYKICTRWTITNTNGIYIYVYISAIIV